VKQSREKPLCIIAIQERKATDVKVCCLSFFKEEVYALKEARCVPFKGDVFTP
jgi:hypothetical protein